jgi:hypothetical protein
MRLRFWKSVFLVAIVFYIPLQSMAWGVLGHRIVAEIADSYLTAKARAEIKKILGTESLAMTSNWPDFIKSDTNFRYLNSWHYINFKKGLSRQQLNDELTNLSKKDSVGDAYTAINFLVKELKKKNLPKDKKIMYLRLLVHIVGDIHQPLHVSPEGSTGGNDIKLTWFGTNSNLHRVWDEHLIEFQQLSYTEYVKAINHTTLSERNKLQQQPLSQWLYDSYVIAQDLQNEITEQNPKLSYRYNFDHIRTLDQQLLIGGVHLAGLLNEIFK